MQITKPALPIVSLMRIVQEGTNVSMVVASNLAINQSTVGMVNNTATSKQTIQEFICLCLELCLGMFVS